MEKSRLGDDEGGNRRDKLGGKVQWQRCTMYVEHLRRDLCKASGEVCTTKEEENAPKTEVDDQRTETAH